MHWTNRPTDARTVRTYGPTDRPRESNAKNFQFNIARAVQSKLRNSKNHFGVDTRYVNVYSCPYYVIMFEWHADLTGKGNRSLNSENTVD